MLVSTPLNCSYFRGVFYKEVNNEDDPNETKNIAAENPKIVKGLMPL